jgi:hypothetical protein
MLEKNGSFELTSEEESLILSGVVPERVKRNWGDLTPEECMQLATNKDTHTDTNNEK